MDEWKLKTQLKLSTKLNVLPAHVIRIRQALVEQHLHYNAINMLNIK